MKTVICCVVPMILGICSAVFGLGPVAANAQEVALDRPCSFPEYSDRYTKNSMAPIMQPGKRFYVSPNGSDLAAGNKHAPFKTFEGARDAIRKLKRHNGLPEGGVEVVVLAGRYCRTKTFELTEEDSGSDGAPIVYRGETGGEVIISGGEPVDTAFFQPVRDADELDRLHRCARGKVMNIDLSDTDLAKFFPGDGDYGMIAMDGHLLQLAQWPNIAYNHIGVFLDPGPSTRHLRNDEMPAPWSRENPNGAKFKFKEPLPETLEEEFRRSGDLYIEGYLHNDWYFQREPIGRVTGDEIELLHHTRYGVKDHIKGMPRRARLINVLAELDEPGEWYFDKAAGKLYVWPIRGFVPGKSSVSLLGGPELIRLEDTEFITFRGLILENGGELTARISGGRCNLFGGCIFRNGFGKGIDIRGGRYNGVTGSEFLGLHGIGGISGGDRREILPCYNFFTNNAVHDCRKRGYGLAGLSGVGIRFANNLLYNLNGAVSFNTLGMLMEYNEWYNIGYEMGDFNVAYIGANWASMSNVQRYNFIHHMIEPGGYPIGPFRNDDGGAGLTIYGNVMYRAGRYAGGFFGPANSLQNNIAIDMPVFWWTVKSAISEEEIAHRWAELDAYRTNGKRGDKGDYLYKVERVYGEGFWKEEPWASKYPILGDYIRGNPFAQSYCQVNTNYYNGIRELAHIHGGRSDMAVGFQPGALEDLPGTCVYRSPVEVLLSAFEDVESLNFNFRSDFQPMPGFKPIPFDRIGLYEDEFRGRAPDKAIYRAEVYEKYKNDRGGRYDADVVRSRYPIPAYLQREAQE